MSEYCSRYCKRRNENVVCLAEVKCPGCFVSRASLTENFHPIGGLVFTLYRRRLSAPSLLPASCLEQGGSGLEFSAKVWPFAMAGNYFRGQYCLSCENDLTYATTKICSNCGRFWMSSKVAAIFRSSQNCRIGYRLEPPQACH